MKLTHRNDGTFTLAGLTGDNLRTLTLALSTLAAAEAQASEGRGSHAHPGQSAAARLWARRQWHYVDAIGGWLRTANQYGGDGLRRRSSTTFDQAEPPWPTDAEVAAA